MLILQDLVKLTSRGIVKADEYIFVSVGEWATDISPQLLTKLQRTYPLILHYSRAISADRPTDSVTGRPGVALFTGDPVIQNESAQTYGKYAVSRLNGEIFIYRLRKRFGKWRIQSRTSRAISGIVTPQVLV